MMHGIVRGLLGGLFLSVAVCAKAQDLALKIDHETTALGADGVTRITRFSERLVRRDNQSWLSRLLPPVVHEDKASAGADKNHKHMDVNAAARWVFRGQDGQLRVRIVNVHDRLVVDVGPADYGNIGFDGRWTTAYQLMDPAQLQRMKVSDRPAPAGARWYEGVSRDARVQLLWDEKAGYPRRIESSNARGTLSSQMVATPEAMPSRLPWSGVAAYAQKEYADLLD